MYNSTSGGASGGGKLFADNGEIKDKTSLISLNGLYRVGYNDDNSVLYTIHSEKIYRFKVKGEEIVMTANKLFKLSNLDLYKFESSSSSDNIQAFTDESTQVLKDGSIYFSMYNLFVYKDEIYGMDSTAMYKIKDDDSGKKTWEKVVNIPISELYNGVGMQVGEELRVYYGTGDCYKLDFESLIWTKIDSKPLACNGAYNVEDRDNPNQYYILFGFETGGYMNAYKILMNDSDFEITRIGIRTSVGNKYGSSKGECVLVRNKYFIASCLRESSTQSSMYIDLEKNTIYNNNFTNSGNKDIYEDILNYIFYGSSIKLGEHTILTCYSTSYSASASIIVDKLYLGGLIS